MEFDPKRHRRRSIRLRGFDYAHPGGYFVTICTHEREFLFGDVVEGQMRPNQAGEMIRAVWLDLRHRWPGVDLDAFIVMPNHVHGVIILVGAGLAPPRYPVGAGLAPPTEGAASSAPTGPTLADVIRAFKSISAIRVNRLLSRSGRPLWQRNYYEHVIRTDNQLNIIREYIATNPLRWQFDPENPDAEAADDLELPWDR